MTGPFGGAVAPDGADAGATRLELPLLAPLFRLDRWLVAAEVGLLGLLLAGMIFLGLGQVVLREFFQSGWSWADGLLRHFVLLTGLFGAMTATHARRHLAMDALVRVLPDSLRRGAEVIAEALSGFTCFWLLVIVVPYLRDELAHGGEEVAFGITQAQFQIAFPVALAVMGFRFTLLALNDGLLLCFPRAEAALLREKGN
ncbi:MAG: TRAP transporter small permease subunit [Candidatus Sericytochromatia bacterium]|nr:TRAP transporter small permease subunit [Candidatus Tanganyikabacteria bacterium]